MAGARFRTVNEMVGRADFLEKEKMVLTGNIASSIIADSL